MAEAIELKTHAKRGPSGARARKLCPGKVVLEEGLTDKPTRYAAEGTVAHSVMELCLADTAEASQLGLYVEPRDAEGFVGRVFEADGFEFEVDEEMAEAVNRFVAGVLQHIDPAAGDILLVEQQVPIGHITGEEGATGTADVVGICKGGTELVVLDLKYGKGVAVYAIYREIEEMLTDASMDETDTWPVEIAVRNEQLMEYALGALEEHGLLYPFETVTFGIGQPRKYEELDVASMTMEEAAEELKRMKRIEAACDSAEADAKSAHFLESWVRPSYDACKFCKAKGGHCPALNAEVAETVSIGAASVDDFADLDVMNVAEAVAQTEAHDAKVDDTVTSGVLDAMMAKVPLIEEWCKAVRAEMDDYLLNRGGQSTMFKVVQGKRGNRRFTDPVEAAAYLKSARLKVDEMFNQKLKSPKQIEDAIAKDKPRVWKKLQDYITQSDGKPSVAPMSDKREAINVATSADDFADLGVVEDDGSDLL